MKGGRINIKAFAGANSSSPTIPFYQHLEQYSYDAAIIHVAINVISRSQDTTNLNDLTENFIKFEEVRIVTFVIYIYIYIYIYVYFI